MGNCFRRCIRDDDSDLDTYYPQYSHGGHAGGGYPSRPGSITFTAVGFTAFARDLLEFEITNEVPKALSDYVSASKATQKIWFTKLLNAWRQANPTPASKETVALLLIRTLQGCSDIQGLLRFYHLPYLTVPAVQPVHVPANPPVPVPATQPVLVPNDAGEIEYEIYTLPVKWKEGKGDGDGLTVFVNVLENARETKLLPKEVHDAVLLRDKARAQKNYEMADAFQKKIEDANYKVLDGKNDGAWCLARKYKIRLRGVDAPEIKQPYGKEARDELRDLVKDQQLLIRVYNTDKYERKVGDIYCNGMFIQEELLKRGSVWHYEYFDKRETFAEWHRDAKEACIGLWADPNPEAPWDYRKRFRKRGSFRGRGA